MIDIESFPLTYQRGHRHVFASLGVKGAMPSSSAKHVLDKGKEKVKSPSLLRKRKNMNLSKSFN